MWLLFATVISMTQQYVVFVSSDSFVLYIYQFEKTALAIVVEISCLVKMLYFFVNFDVWYSIFNSSILRFFY